MDIILLESVQRRTTKMIQGLGDLIEVFKTVMSNNKAKYKVKY